MMLVDEAWKTGQPTHGEWRVVWPDESVHWIAGRWQVLMEESGEPSRVVGVDMDIIERKLSEAALANVSRKLIEAQEHERTRIGRELSRRHRSTSRNVSHWARTTPTRVSRFAC
jgi:signal transduction histidine kinase